MKYGIKSVTLERIEEGDAVTVNAIGEFDTRSEEQRPAIYSTMRFRPGTGGVYGAESDEEQMIYALGNLFEIDPKLIKDRMGWEKQISDKRKGKMKKEKPKLYEACIHWIEPESNIDDEERNLGLEPVTEWVYIARVPGVNNQEGAFEKALRYLKKNSGLIDDDIFYFIDETESFDDILPWEIEILEVADSETGEVVYRKSPL